MQPDNTQTDIDKIPVSQLSSWGGYWRSRAVRERKLHDVSTRHIVIGQVCTMVATMTAGLFVQDHKSALLLIGTAFLLYPVLVDVLSSSSAIISAEIHHEIDDIAGSKVWFIAVLAAKVLATTLLGCLVIGLIASAIGSFVFDTPPLLTIELAIVVSLIASAIGLPIMIIVTLLARRMQSNPDDVTPPFETTIFSIVVLAATIIASRYLT